jgi:hypothetical protein
MQESGQSTSMTMVAVDRLNMGSVATAANIPGSRPQQDGVRQANPCPSPR